MIAFSKSYGSQHTGHLSLFPQAFPTLRAVMQSKQIRRPGSHHGAAPHWLGHPERDTTLSPSPRITISTSGCCWKIKTHAVLKPVSGTQYVHNIGQDLKK